MKDDAAMRRLWYALIAGNAIAAVVCSFPVNVINAIVAAWLLYEAWIDRRGIDGE